MSARVREARERRRRRELERVHRLLRRLDLGEVLEELGLEVLYFRGADAYVECPDPDHDDANPSCHVCVEDVEEVDGSGRLGAFNCWSHPKPGLRGSNFLNLAARALYGIWGDDADGEPRWPTEEDRDRAATWLRSTFLGRGEVTLDRRREDAVAARRRRRDAEEGQLLWPPCEPVASADPRFQIYLSRRGVTPQRAEDLGVMAVRHGGEALARTLGNSTPGVLFPIHWDGAPVSWFVRAVSRGVAKDDRGRYAPRARLGKLGVLWQPDVPDLTCAMVLVEGIFDAERVKTLAQRAGVHPGNVDAVLGGKLTPEQARRLRAYPEVIHLEDGDDAGEALTASIREHLAGFTSVTAHKLPRGTDPGDAPEEEILRALSTRRASTSTAVGRRFRRRRVGR